MTMTIEVKRRAVPRTLTNIDALAIADDGLAFVIHDRGRRASALTLVNDRRCDDDARNARGSRSDARDDEKRRRAEDDEDEGERFVGFYANTRAKGVLYVRTRMSESCEWKSQSRLRDDGGKTSSASGTFATWFADGSTRVASVDDDRYLEKFFASTKERRTRNAFMTSEARVGALANGEQSECAACATCATADEATAFVATLRALASGRSELVLRKASVSGIEEDKGEGQVVARATYEDARELFSAGGEDFWVVTTRGAAYRWNCRLKRAVGRVDVGAVKDARGEFDVTASSALTWCVSFPKRALTCVDGASGRAYEIAPALAAPGERAAEDIGGESAIRELCALERPECCSTALATSAARHGAFLWIAYGGENRGCLSEDGKRKVLCFHAATGTLVATAALEHPSPRASSVATTRDSRDDEREGVDDANDGAFVLVNGGVSGMYAYAPSSVAPPVIYEMTLHVPSALAAVVAPLLISGGASSSRCDVATIDAIARDVEMYGACTERLSQALLIARREAEFAPEAFKRKREDVVTSSAHVSAMASTAPALLLRARLAGRFDDVATARWWFAVNEALEAMDAAASEFGSYSRLAAARAQETRDILTMDWDAARACGDVGERQSFIRVVRESGGDVQDGAKGDGDDDIAAVVRALEVKHRIRAGVDALSLPSYAWVAARALVALDGSSDVLVREFVDAVWRGVPLDVVKASSAVEDDFTRGLARSVDIRVTALVSAPMLAPFEAMVHLLFRIAPRFVIPFIDAKAEIVSVVDDDESSMLVRRTRLAFRALATAPSPIEHLERFNDAIATDALARAVAHTLCAADAPRAGMRVALMFGGHYARPDIVADARGAARKTLACRGKTTLAGWGLATQIFAFEVAARRLNAPIDARRFASEAFASVSAAFRALVEDWNDFPLRKSPNDVDVDAAAEFVMRCADIARSAFDARDGSSVRAALQTRALILDEARAMSATMTEVAQSRRDDDPKDSLHVDSLEQLVTACAHALREMTCAQS